MMPIEHAAISVENIGSTAPIIMSQSPPSLPSVADAATRSAVAGDDALPRRRSPSSYFGWMTSSVLLSTSRKVLAPASAAGARDQT